MRFSTGCLAAALVASLVSGGAGVSAGSSTRVAAPGPRAEGAKDYRDKGRGLLHRGRTAEALAHLMNALKAFQQSGDKPGEASTQDLLGELYERQGRYDLAQNYYLAAHNLYAASAKPAKGGKLPDLPGGAAKGATSAVSSAAALTAEERDYNARLMLAKVGNMLYRLGDLEGARTSYERLAVSVKPPKKSGFMDKVRDSALATGADIVSGGDVSVRVGVPSGLGLLKAKTEFDRYRQAILYASLELGLGRMDFKQAKLDSAREHFKNALKTTESDLPLVGRLGQSRRFRAAARTSLGDVAFEQKQYKEAAKLYKEAEEGARADKRLDLMWPAQRGSGRSLWELARAEKDQKKAQKMREDALGAYGQALATVETLRQGSVRADESRTTFLATTGGVFEEAAGALAEMALLTQAGPSTANASVEGPALKYAAEALDVVERGRARSLLDMLNESGAEIAGDDVPRDLLEQRRANQTRQAEIAAQLMGVNLGESEKEKKPKELEEELDDLQTKFDVIENNIRTKSRRYNSLTGGVPLTLEEIRGQVLDDDTTLLEYSLGEERSYLLAVTRTDFRVSRLPGREEVGRLVVDFRRQLLPTSARRSLTDLVAEATDPQRGLKVAQAKPNFSPALVKAYAEAARSLYAATVEPAAPLFKGSRLLVVADGALNYVPFHALVTAAPPEGADFTTLEYLLNKNETVFAPSASVVAAIRQQRAATPDASSAGGMLVVADPVFDPADARARVAGAASAQQAGADAGRAPGFDSAVEDVAEGVKVADMQAAAGARRVALVRLAGTGEEAAQIKELAGRAGRKADVWTGLQANEGELEARDLRGYRVLHFATHGLLNAERPQFTGVVLSLVGNREGADGFLRADEVYNLKLGSPLVMLSACETGLGREKRGEGVMGLTRAFMYAGAPTVGVTLWPVADRQTADLMGSFYRTLLGAQPTTASAAMHQARRAMLARKESSAPFYWAPFVLVGDWK